MSGVYPVDVREELINQDCEYREYNKTEGRADNDMLLEASIYGCRVRILIDSGAQITLINDKFIEKNKQRYKKIPILPLNNTVITTATGEKQRVSKQVMTKINVQDIEIEITALIVKNLVYDVIVGVDTLRRLQAIIDFNKRQISIVINKKPYKIRLDNNEKRSVQSQPSCEISKPVVKPMNLKDNNKYIRVNNMTTDQLKQLNDVLQKYSKVFNNQPTITNVYEHKITVNNTGKFDRRIYNIPANYKQQVDCEIQKMLDNRVIERADSTFLNPMVAVRKKNKEVRICLDMRSLNSMTDKSYDRAPNPENLFNKCQGVKFMSRLDLKKGFWQIPLEKNSRKYTAFLYKNRVYQYRVVPFGLNTSLAAMVRCMERALGPEVEEFVSVFVDDVLIISKSFKEHLEHLEIVLKKLMNANLVLNREKCEFGKSNIKFLGHIITAEGISTDPEKIQAITDFPRPRRTKDVRAFLGLTGYYRRFTPEYSKTIEALLELLKKNVKWCWEECQEEAFKATKELYRQNLHLFHPEENGTFVLNCDASDYAIGGVLYQRNNKGEYKVIAYANRSLKGAEKNYFTSEKEILAIVYCISKWRYYLIGGHFEILSDNQALSFMLKCKLSNARISRWIMAIQEYDFSIRYCKGSENQVADTLSRYPQEIEEKHTASREEIQILAVKYNISANLKDKLRNIGQHQQLDSKLKKIMDSIKEREDPKYILEQDTLYKLNNARWKVMVPDGLVEELTWACHESLAHAGPYKCFLALREDFIWINMLRKIKSLLRTCHTCQTAKYPNLHTCVEMGNIVTRSKNELVCIDFLGPLPRAARGLKNLVVITDAFTKYVSLYPVGRPTTDAVLKVVLDKYVPKHGQIQKLLSDQGKQFTNKRWSCELEKNNIKAILTAIRRPQGNLAERVNRELARLFRTYCNVNQSKWPEYLEMFEKALNESYNDTTGYTPMELQMGKVPERIWDGHINRCSTQNLEVPEIVKKIEAHKRIKNYADARTEKYNTEHKLVGFKVGERILLKALNVGHRYENTVAKFFRLYNGPFVLSEKVGKNTFIVSKPDNGRVIGKFHASALRKYYCKE